MVDRSKWPALVSAVEQTLLNVSTLPLERAVGVNSCQKTNRLKFISEREKRTAKVFDADMSNEAFWAEIVEKPLWTDRGSAFGGRIEATARHMKLSGEWLKPGPERTAMEADPDYLFRGQRQEAVEGALTLIRAAIQSSPTGKAIDYYVPEYERDFSERSLKSIFDRMSKLGLGPATTFHAMMDLGLPVVKPDQVVVLFAVRLGLVRDFESVKEVRGNRTTTTTPLPATLPQGTLTVDKLAANLDFVWTLQGVMRSVAAEAKITVRELDYLFVKLGAKANPSDGLVRSVCATTPIECHNCHANSMCNFGRFNRKETRKLAA